MSESVRQGASVVRGGKLRFAVSPPGLWAGVGVCAAGRLCCPGRGPSQSGRPVLRAHPADGRHSRDGLLQGGGVRTRLRLRQVCQTGVTCLKISVNTRASFFKDCSNGPPFICSMAWETFDYQVCSSFLFSRTLSPSPDAVVIPGLVDVAPRVCSGPCSGRVGYHPGHVHFSLDHCHPISYIS